MTHGQQSALGQLREVERHANGLFTVDAVVEPTDESSFLIVDVTLFCADLERAVGGLPLQEREQFRILVPTNFPFEYPSILTRHQRFAGFSHVQWTLLLCLYQSPATEWNPSDGMYGFLDRLHYWLKQGALNQLDPVGAPLHPPVTYQGEGPTRTIIPRVNTPVVGSGPWFGTAHLNVLSDVRMDITGWTDFLDSETPADVAAAILLPSAFPYEFPTKMVDLIASLETQGVTLDQFFWTLQWAVVNNESEKPLYVVLGVPMRGISGERPKQHLTAWYIEPTYARALKLAIHRFSDDPKKRQLGKEIDGIMREWAKLAPINWCAVREERPEIVTRRDRGSPMSWFANKTVAVYGCGALGGRVAEFLARAEAKKLILRDNGIVTPGVLVRQPFDDIDIGERKVEVLQRSLQRIRPTLEIEIAHDAVEDDPTVAQDWTAGADVVIDATASTSVMVFLERLRWQSKVRVPLISMAIGHTAERGMVTVALPLYSGGPLDLSRRLKLAACARPELQPYLDEFWPIARNDFFQPEPGCSDPTFRGSAVDVAALVAMMLNQAVIGLAKGSNEKTGLGYFVAQPHVADGSTGVRFEWEAEHVCLDIHAGYEIRIAKSAWKECRKWILKNRDLLGSEPETGGLLFGERDDAAGIVWVSDASDAPSDSECTPERFICGVVGTQELHAEKKRQTRGSKQYLGMWHTHPNCEPYPSSVDLYAMRRLLTITGAGRTLMMIVGHPHELTPFLGTYLFKPADFRIQRGIMVRQCSPRQINWDD